MPVIRGLDSVLWSIYKDIPLGVTAHLINKNIDAGLLVYQEQLNFSQKDNMESLYEKNYQLQLDLIPISLNLVLKNKNFKILKMGEYHHKMPYKTQLTVIKKTKQYIKTYAPNDKSEN